MPEFSFELDQDYAPAPVKSYEPLERGDYQCIVIETSIKTTKAGTGEYIEVVLQVVDGEHSGRRLWDRLNVSNPNKQAEEIARRQLTGLCQAVGMDMGSKLANTEQLHDIPMSVAVDIDRKDPTRNRIVAYNSLGASSPATAPVSDAAAEAPSSNKKPWEK